MRAELGRCWVDRSGCSVRATTLCRSLPLSTHSRKSSLGPGIVPLKEFAKHCNTAVFTSIVLAFGSNIAAFLSSWAACCAFLGL